MATNDKPIWIARKKFYDVTNETISGRVYTLNEATHLVITGREISTSE